MPITYPNPSITPIPNTSPYATPSLWNIRYTQINENFAAVSTELDKKANINSPEFTGTVRAPNLSLGFSNGLPVASTHVVNVGALSSALAHHKAQRNELAHPMSVAGSVNSNGTAPTGMQGGFMSGAQAAALEYMSSKFVYGNNNSATEVMKVDTSFSAANSNRLLATTAWVNQNFGYLARNVLGNASSSASGLQSSSHYTAVQNHVVNGIASGVTASDSTDSSLIKRASNSYWASNSANRLVTTSWIKTNLQNILLNALSGLGMSFQVATFIGADWRAGIFKIKARILGHNTYDGFFYFVTLNGSSTGGTIRNANLTNNLPAGIDWLMCTGSSVAGSSFGYVSARAHGQTITFENINNTNPTQAYSFSVFAIGLGAN